MGAGVCRHSMYLPCRYYAAEEDEARKFLTQLESLMIWYKEVFLPGIVEKLAALHTKMPLLEVLNSKLASTPPPTQNEQPPQVRQITQQLHVSSTVELDKILSPSDQEDQNFLHLS